ncbi:MAG: hypothetical protein LBE84_12205 [Planctomycetota bacterium]|nr:hypothetical protein [Planctomycetota bacterium]
MPPPGIVHLCQASRTQPDPPGVLGRRPTEKQARAVNVAMPFGQAIPAIGDASILGVQYRKVVDGNCASVLSTGLGIRRSGVRIPPGSPL